MNLYFFSINMSINIQLLKYAYNIYIFHLKENPKSL